LTERLAALRQGNDAARNQIFELAYAELRLLAAQRLRSFHGAGALSPTELMHEAVIRVIGANTEWQDRVHFFASMSVYMRAVLLDHARALSSERRGGAVLHVTLSHADAGSGVESEMADLLALDRALHALEAQDPRSATVLHLSCFAGLDRHAIAVLLEVSVQVVDRELRFAKSWINAQLEIHL
jgi:RNA polymerase sigma factor (TIGR02999 family)